jgi:hypothetical protein
MLIPLRNVRAGGTGARALTRAQSHSRPTWKPAYTTAALRGLVPALGMLWWFGGAPVDLPTLAAALGLSAAGLAAHTLRPLPGPSALLVDAAAVGLLIHATGDAMSPFLALALTLVALGCLSDGGRDTLVGGGAGLLMLLLVCLAGPDEGRGTALGMAVAHIAVAGAAAWAQRHGRAEQNDTGHYDALLALDWQRLNLAVVSGCASAEELARRVAERATTISGAYAAVEAEGGERAVAGDGSSGLVIPAAGLGRLVVRARSGALAAAQREALEHLTSLAGMRATALLAARRLRRQQEAMLALWEAAGMVRIAPGLDDTMRDACRRIARALELDWLAVLGPSGRQPIAPLMVVQGRAGDAPRMEGAQLRVAAEALRVGQPLVRAEGAAVLACLPVRLPNDTPLVLAARGDTSEAGTQALLMVFGDLLAAGMASQLGNA